MADDPWAVVSTTPLATPDTTQASQSNDPWAVTSTAPIGPQAPVDQSALGANKAPPVVPSIAPQGDPEGIGSGRFSAFGQGVRDMGNSVIQKVAASAPDSVVQWLGHNYPHDIGPSETSDYHYTPEDILTMTRNQGAEYEANKKASDRANSWDIPRMAGNAAALGTGMGELGPMAAGAVSGALQPNYNAHNAEDVGVGALESGTTGAILGKTLDKFGKFLSPNVNTAIKYFTDRGVYPTLGQIAEMADTKLSALPASLEANYSRLPFIGNFVNSARKQSVADMNKMAYDDALAPIHRTTTKDTKAGQDGLQEVASHIDDAYDAAKKKLTFKADQDYIDNVADLNDKLYGDVTHLQLPNGSIVPNPDAGMGAFDKPLRDLYHRVTGSFNQAASDANTMDGETLVRAQSVLKGTIKDLASGDANEKALSRLLKDYNDNVDSALQRTNSPKDLQDLTNAHKSYQLYQRLVDASVAGKNNGFIFTPNQYMNSIAKWSGKNQLARGEAVNQPFAESASDLFGNTIRDSGTTAGRDWSAMIKHLSKTVGTNTAAAGAATVNPFVAGAVTAAPLLTHNDLSRKYIAKMLAGDRPAGSEQMSDLLKTVNPYVSGPTANATLGNDTPDSQPHFATGGLADQTDMALDKLSDEDKAYNARQADSATATLSFNPDRNSVRGFPTDAQASVYPLSGESLAPAINAGMNRPMNDTEGSLDHIANVAQRIKPQANPDAAPLMHTAYAMSRNNAIAALGFDPNQIALDMSPDETNLGGFYDPDKDVVFAKGKTNPESLVHESIHRGISALKDSGMLTKQELALVKSSGDQETAVRYIMATRMGDPDNNPKYDIGQMQRNLGINYYSWHDDDKKLLDNIELKAARLLGVKQLEDAKQTPKNVDGQMQNLLNVARTGAQ